LVLIVIATLSGKSNRIGSFGSARGITLTSRLLADRSSHHQIDGDNAMDNSKNPTISTAPIYLPMRAGQARLAEPPAAEKDNLDAFAGDRSFVMSFARGVSVIQAFAHVSRSLSIAEISHRIHIPRAAVRRLLHTLCELGFVRVVGLRYALTPKVLQLGHAFASSNDAVLGVQPIVSSLAARLHSFCALLVQEDDDTMLMCVAGTSAGTVGRNLAPGPGSRAPLYASASGMVFLSNFSERQLDAYFGRVAMLPLTFRTQTMPEQIRLSIGRVQQQGYSVCDRTFSNNLRSVAMPVRDARGSVVAAMVTVVQADRLTGQELRATLLPELGAAAIQAARHLQ
jgi:IclR family pca regulon transcriptional regulator